MAHFNLDPNDLADWDDEMMSEIDGWFLPPEQQQKRAVDNEPNLLHKLYQELADEEIARVMQTEWHEPAQPKPKVNYNVVARAVPHVSTSHKPATPVRNETYDSAALATFMQRVSRAPSTEENDHPTQVRVTKRAPRLRQLIHMLRREKELAAIRHKMGGTRQLVTDDEVKAEEERLKSEKPSLSDVSVEDDASPIPEEATDEQDDVVAEPVKHYLTLQREELASLTTLFATVRTHHCVILC